MIIRVATASDVSGIANLHTESWRIAYRGLMRDDYLDKEIYAEREAVWRDRFQRLPVNQYIVVAEEKGELIGFACTYGNDDARWGALLDNLHAAPDRKRQGIGTKLMAATAEWCLKTYPTQGLYLWVLEQNIPARRFYERVGGIHVESGMWDPPDGSPLPKMRFVWEDPAVLLL